ncbi:hypothetical protein [Bradyrhizobium sp. WD16]|uniref:hypothetical protein n=1 Tax=Bradyrhizobium sp. WD16 TaxID=1521768 RepID=UPI0020A57669|nr:hypothetical protein [Bradyrhizobium sp. WD16]UTD28220.1 hypothetical protein DB459_16295 [Bradyrhizobium sp. WD16]
MSDPIPFDASIALRMKAVEAARRARALPPGPERNEWRQIALAYRALSENEAWLSGVRVRGRAARALGSGHAANGKGGKRGRPGGTQ